MKDSIYKRQFDAIHDGPLPVSHISVTGTGTLSTVLDDGDKGVYHWYLTLHLQDSPAEGLARTVTLDSQPTNYPEATLIVKSAPPCADPHKVEVTVPTLGDPTASDILDYLVEEGLARYVYAEGGFGCRWWCRIALQKLEAKGWVAVGAEDKYVELQRGCAERDPERFPNYLKKGTFMPKVSVVALANVGWMMLMMGSGLRHMGDRVVSAMMICLRWYCTDASVHFPCPVPTYRIPCYPRPNTLDSQLRDCLRLAAFDPTTSSSSVSSGDAFSKSPLPSRCRRLYSDGSSGMPFIHIPLLASLCSAPKYIISAKIQCGRDR